MFDVINSIEIQFIYKSTIWMSACRTDQKRGSEEKGDWAPMIALLQNHVSLAHAGAHHGCYHMEKGLAVDAGVEGKDHGITRESA